MKIQRTSKTTVRLVFWGVALSVSGGATALAQSVPATPAPTDMVVRIMAARRANAALMRQYSWTSRTEVIDQGQVKELRLDTVNYGPSGQLQRTTINDQSAPLPRGFLRRRIAEDERTKVEQYFGGVAGVARTVHAAHGAEGSGLHESRDGDWARCQGSVRADGAERSLSGGCVHALGESEDEAPATDPGREQFPRRPYQSHRHLQDPPHRPQPRGLRGGDRARQAAQRAGAEL